MSPVLRLHSHPQDGGVSQLPYTGRIPPTPGLMAAPGCLSRCGFPLLSYFCFDFLTCWGLGSGVWSQWWEVGACDTVKRQPTLESDVSRFETKLYLPCGKLLHLLDPRFFNLLNRSKWRDGRMDGWMDGWINSKQMEKTCWH